jgi:succinate dehydrogenase/fumarate reductase-like Fe-S protein
MGVCHECRVTVNGRAHVLACQTLCSDGMQIETAK